MQPKPAGRHPATDLPILVDPKHLGRAAVDPLAFLVVRERVHERSVDEDLRLVLEHHCGCRRPLGVVLADPLSSNRPQLYLLPWPQLQDDNGPAEGQPISSGCIQITLSGNATKHWRSTASLVCTTAQYNFLLAEMEHPELLVLQSHLLFLVVLPPAVDRDDSIIPVVVV